MQESKKQRRVGGGFNDNPPQKQQIALPESIDPNEEKQMSSSPISQSFQINDNQSGQDSKINEIKQKKTKLTEEKISSKHLKRNQEIVSGFQAYSKEVMLDEESKERYNDFQSIMDGIINNINDKQIHLNKLQKILNTFEINEITSKDETHSFSSQIPSNPNAQIFGMMQNSPNNLQILQNRIDLLSDSTQKISDLIENEEEKIFEHQNMISNLKCTTKIFSGEVTNLNDESNKYSKQILSMEENILVITKQAAHLEIQKNEISSYISKEDQDNMTRIKQYREAAEEYQSQIREELKVYNYEQDITQKLQDRLIETNSINQNLQQNSEDFLFKQQIQQELIQKMNEFNLLANMFIYNDPNQSLNEGGDAQICEMNSVELSWNQDTDTINSIKSNQATLKEEIIKFEELHKNGFESVVDQLIFLYHKLSLEHQTMGTRSQDLLSQKNELITLLNSNLEENGGLEIRAKFQEEEALKSEYIQLFQNIHRAEKNEHTPSFQVEIKDISTVQQLVSKCFFFLTQTLFRLGRILSSTQSLMKQAKEEKKPFGNKKYKDIKVDLLDFKVANTLVLSEEEKSNQENILKQSNILFENINDIILFTTTSTNMIQPQMQEYPASPQAAIIPLADNQNYEQQKSQILMKVYQEKLYGLPDVSQEFFDFLKQDFLVNYFCDIKVFINFFSSIRIQIEENINEFEVEWMKRQERYNISDIKEYEIVIQKDRKDIKLKDVVLNTLFSRLEDLRNAGQEHFKDTFKQGLEYLTSLVNKSSDISKQLLEFLKQKIPFFSHVSLNEQLIANEKEYFKKMKYSEKKPPLETSLSSKDTVNWKERILLKKIEQLELRTGKEKIHKTRTETSSNSNQNKHSFNYLNPNYIPSRKDKTEEDDEDDTKDANRKNSEEEEEEREATYMNSKRQETKILEAKYSNNNLEKDSKYLKNSKYESLYTEQRKYDLKLSLQSKEMLQYIKSYQKLRSLSTKSSLPSLSTFDIKVGFQTQRATLGLQNYNLSMRKESEKQINQNDSSPKELLSFNRKNKMEFYRRDTSSSIKQRQNIRSLTCHSDSSMTNNLFFSGNYKKNSRSREVSQLTELHQERKIMISQSPQGRNKRSFSNNTINFNYLQTDPDQILPKSRQNHSSQRQQTFFEFTPQKSALASTMESQILDKFTGSLSQASAIANGSKELSLKRYSTKPLYLQNQSKEKSKLLLPKPYKEKTLNPLAKKLFEKETTKKQMILPPSNSQLFNNEVEIEGVVKRYFV